MVGTVRAGRQRGAIAFAGGLGLGAAAFFGALGALGAAFHPGAIAVAAVVGAAALMDLAGLRVRPQVRFQVPERWRRTMPLPRALFLYGLLLGTGVTTLVPAAAAWALLVLCVALGSVPAAVVVGLSFAIGRALPVLVLAARDAETALAERPQGLRVLRVLAAGALVAALLAGAARAATPVAAPAGDPGAVDTDVVWQEPGIGGFLLRNGVKTPLPGNDPAVGDAYIAWHVGDTVTVAARDTLAPVLELSIPGVEKLAVSETWLVYRLAFPSGREEIQARSLADPATARVLTHARARGRLGRPSLSQDIVLYHLDLGGRSSLMAFDLGSGKKTVLRSSTQALLLNPARVGGKLLYVRVGRCAQQLRLGSLSGAGAGRVLYRLPPLAGEDLGHERGHTTQGEHLPCPYPPKPTARMLWTTALTPAEAYVTVLRPSGGGHTTPSLLAIAR
jgi:hypothetical protein